MKRAVILHGTDSSPDSEWKPWLITQLQKAGYEVYAPSLPDSHTPNRKGYEKFLRESEWDFTDNVLFGHSSGATTVLNVLMAEWFPHVKAAVLVGTFLNERLTKTSDWYDPGQFDNLFLEKYDPEVLASKADAFYFVHGSNDPYCDIEDAKRLSNQVNGTFITVENGHHLGSASAIRELPQITDALLRDGLM
jgi:predicted alpha/beta hydrolase family esterase